MGRSPDNTTSLYLVTCLDGTRMVVPSNGPIQAQREVLLRLPIRAARGDLQPVIASRISSVYEVGDMTFYETCHLAMDGQAGLIYWYQVAKGDFTRWVAIECRNEGTIDTWKIVFYHCRSSVSTLIPTTRRELREQAVWYILRKFERLVGEGSILRSEMRRDLNIASAVL